MIVTLSIPDDVYQRVIDEHNATNPNKALVELIKRFIDYPPTARALFFPDEERGALEKLYGEPIDKTNTKRFVEWVRQRAAVNLGEVNIPLSAGQLKRAASNATALKSRDGQPAKPEVIADYVRGVVQESVRASLGA